MACYLLIQVQWIYHNKDIKIISLIPIIMRAGDSIYQTFFAKIEMNLQFLFLLIKQIYCSDSNLWKVLGKHISLYRIRYI